MAAARAGEVGKRREKGGEKTGKRGRGWRVRTIDEPARKREGANRIREARTRPWGIPNERDRGGYRTSETERDTERGERAGGPGGWAVRGVGCGVKRQPSTPSRTVSFSRKMSRWGQQHIGEGPCIYVTSAQDRPIGSMPSPRRETTGAGGAEGNRRDPRGTECMPRGPTASASNRVIAGESRRTRRRKRTIPETVRARRGRLEPRGTPRP